MKYTNTTPHDINVYSNNGEKLFTLSPELDIRASSNETTVSDVGGLVIVRQVLGAPVIKTLHGELITMEDLPEEGLVVSLIAVGSLRAAGFKGELLTPNTAPGRVVRDPEGRILGCTGFVLQP